jgi:RecB family exonuclease
MHNGGYMTVQYTPAEFRIRLAEVIRDVVEADKLKSLKEEKTQTFLLRKQLRQSILLKVEETK